MIAFIRPAVLLAACAAVCGAPAARAQHTYTDSAAFVVRMGSDTVAVERYVRKGGHLRGTFVSRTPRTVVRTYDATLLPDGRVSRIEAWFGLPGAAPMVRAVTEYAADSAVLRVTRGDSTAVQRFATGGVIFPFIGQSAALYEQAVMHALRQRGDSVRVMQVSTGGGAPWEMVIRRMGGDSVGVVNFEGASRLRVDRAGRIVRFDGRGSTDKVLIERLGSFDVDAFAAAGAARDARGQGMGNLSPRDSAVATVGGAHLWVDYGRPSKRGRQVVGYLIPFDSIWRTGANAATQLRTDRDLAFGSTVVPAGTYSVWTQATRAGWRLILNRQTGQWGTEHDAAQDFASIPLAITRADPPVERFTIVVEPTATGGVLALVWDDTRASAAFT
ncbi:MAG TPA: DUF2911 domain-containing protein, partial [Longimicrobiaceae bacterium]|nr:DUF2911 domain-containing protein [Longimicrobiaceae bacterium]